MVRWLVDDDLTAVAPAVLWVDELAHEAGIGEDTRYGIQVCLEEALTNLILHGSAPSGRKTIIVEFDLRGPAPHLIVFDDCAPFDVVRAVATLPERRPAGQIGGNGLRLLRDFATALSYRSVDGQNTLEIAFRPVT